MLTSTKKDIIENRERIIPLVVVLKALSHGVPVKVNNKELEMQNGKIFVAGRKIPQGTTSWTDKSWNKFEKHYIGYSGHMPLESLVVDIQLEIKENPDFLEGLRHETAVVAVLNKL